MTDPLAMVSATNLRISSPELDILVCTSPQDIPNDHPSTTLSSCETTHRQRQRCRTRLSKDDTKPDYSKGKTQEPQEYARTLSKRGRPQARKIKDRFNPRLVHAERVKGAGLLKLDHAEQIPSRYTKGESRRMRSPDTSDVDLPLIRGLQATAVPHEISLPTPPDSELGSDPNDCGNGVRTSRLAGVPSYRFVPTPQSPSVNSLSSPGTPHPTKALNLHSAQRTTPPITDKPLLNLTWRDQGNGISRAYPKYESPPASLADPVEGFDYFIDSDSDEETTVSQDPPHKRTTADKTIESKYGLFFDGRTLKTSSKPLSRREEPIEISSDSEVEIIEPKAVLLPPYTFVATPPSTPKQINSTPEADNLQTTIDSNIDTNHDSNDTIPSNIQPAHLNPHRMAATSPSQSTEIEHYNPNTSSGFSDTSSDTEPEMKLFPYFKRCKPGADLHMSKKRRRELRDRQKHTATSSTATKKFSHPETQTFTRVAVLRAAERVVGRRGIKRL